MKLNLSYLLAFGVVLTLGIGATISAHAQEEGIPGYELQDPGHPGIGNEEKTLLLDPETRSFRRDTLTTYTRPAVKKTEASKPTASGKPKNEEDPLSFNFLYYIIQKFKVSDLVDQQ